MQGGITSWVQIKWKIVDVGRDGVVTPYIALPLSFQFDFPVLFLESLHGLPDQNQDFTVGRTPLIGGQDVELVQQLLFDTNRHTFD